MWVCGYSFGLVIGIRKAQSMVQESSGWVSGWVLASCWKIAWLWQNIKNCYEYNVNLHMCISEANLMKLENKLQSNLRGVCPEWVATCQLNLKYCISKSESMQFAVLCKPKLKWQWTIGQTAHTHTQSPDSKSRIVASRGEASRHSPLGWEWSSQFSWSRTIEIIAQNVGGATTRAGANRCLMGKNNTHTRKTAERITETCRHSTSISQCQRTGKWKEM